LADIYKRKPDAIGFSCYIWNWRVVQELIGELHKLLPDTDIWLGGPEVTYDAPEILEAYPSLKGIMVGEGEETFRELLKCYVNQEKLVVPGLCLHTGYTPARDLLDMNTLPFLYENLEPFTNKIIYYESSRGCPYRCSYCLSSVDKHVRLRDISVVKRELQFFLDNRVKQVKFVDRTFNCNHKHAMEIWQYLCENDNGVTNFHFEISGDILREDEIALLNKLRPGLVQLEIGVQSTNPQTLKAIHRVMNVERLEQIVADIRTGQNVHLHLDLIAGLPFEDYDSFRHSFNRVYKMKPEQLQLGFLKVLKGSPMHQRAEECGICYLDLPPYEVLATNWLSYEEILRLKAIEEMVELYYNSNQFTHTLPLLETVFATPFDMYEKMVQFYEEKGYLINSPARAYRYEILFEFACRWDSEKADMYRELLTYDMYLRENLKSRPAFLAEIVSADKEYIRKVYREEEQERRLLPSYEQYEWKQLSKMTHMEPFHYPVWDVEAIKKCDVLQQRVQYVLFDYAKRNPLNYEASTQIITG